ncbi:MAG: LysR family transcriptional regulator [Alphaproteobacteria bacterium]|nr:LysR family transcriptional regulator [Alphaproteobacteria bacterium]
MLHEIDLSRVDLNLLVLFEAVLAERHVGRAAARLNLSPSAVSHGLGRLRALLNDPLFLKNPKGVVPTVRGAELAETIAQVLAGVRRVVGDAKVFDAKTSTRRFTIGAPDALIAVMLPPLLSAVAKAAPGINFGTRNILPPWTKAFADLDARGCDVLLLPRIDIPARFVARVLFEERFVVAMRRGHRLGRVPDLKRYCAEKHLLVSDIGDPFGHVDIALAEQGLARRVALTVPNFLMALAVISQTDFVAALPESLVTAYATRFDLVSAPMPIVLERDQIQAVAPQVAMADKGVAWLMSVLQSVPRVSKLPRVRSRRGVQLRRVVPGNVAR